MSSYVYDAVGVEEVAVRVGGGLGETDTGGPNMNIVPRTGGNIFAELMETVKVASLGQISETLVEVGGDYRRSM